jgi:anti-anti-sigma regulatory factor
MKESISNLSSLSSERDAPKIHDLMRDECSKEASDQRVVLCMSEISYTSGACYKLAAQIAKILNAHKGKVFQGCHYEEMETNTDIASKQFNPLGILGELKFKFEE